MTSGERTPRTWRGVDSTLAAPSSTGSPSSTDRAPPPGEIPCSSASSFSGWRLRLVSRRRAQPSLRLEPSAQMILGGPQAALTRVDRYLGGVGNFLHGVSKDHAHDDR